MASINSVRRPVVSPSLNQNDPATSADKAQSQKSSGPAAAQGTRPSEQALRASFTQDTFTPDAGPTAMTNASRLLGGRVTGAMAGPIIDVAVANAGNRPTPSYPAPAQLPNEAYGQVGESPNTTGQIGGAAELAQYAYAGYNGGEFGPVSIAPAKLKQGEPGSPDYTESDAYVVSLSGTEPVTDQSTGWVTNLLVGNQLSSPGLRNAKESILRTVPEGSDLVLTGHSQGGMIAQQLAADPDLKAKYNIVSTVTFGSPLISAGRREGEVHRIAATYDPVPRLSLEAVTAAPWGFFGQQNISTATNNPISSHSINYTDESNPELAKMDALGRVNPERPTRIEVDVSQRVFYSSPTNTIAGTPAGQEIPPPPAPPAQPVAIVVEPDGLLPGTPGLPVFDFGEGIAVS